MRRADECCVLLIKHNKSERDSGLNSNAARTTTAGTHRSTNRIHHYNEMKAFSALCLAASLIAAASGGRDRHHPVRPVSKRSASNPYSDRTQADIDNDQGESPFSSKKV